MSQKERDLIASFGETKSRVIRDELANEIVDALEARLDAEIREGEVSLLQNEYTAEEAIRQLLRERDEARTAFGDLVKIEAQGLARINGLEARVKGVEEERDEARVKELEAQNAERLNRLLP